MKMASTCLPVVKESEGKVSASAPDRLLVAPVLTHIFAGLLAVLATRHLWLDSTVDYSRGLLLSLAKPAAFTPIESTIGGALLGLPVFFMMRYNGKVTGVSGLWARFVFVDRLPDGQWCKVSTMFLAGLIVGGRAVYQVAPDLFDIVRHVPLWQYSVAGVVIGVGTQLGNGCTSGHMLCGLSRLSPRSLGASCSFSAAAIVINALLRFVIAPARTPAPTARIVPVAWASVHDTAVLVAVFLVFLALFAAIAPLVRSQLLSVKSALCATSFLSGFSFAAGLAVAGMTQQSKVLGFLDMFGRWDPSLLCVVIGGVIPNIILFIGVIKTTAAPLFESEFSIPKLTRIDARLITGAVLFGLGWGFSGLCPGPILASLGTGAGPVVVTALGFVLGLFVYRSLVLPCIS